MIIEFEGALAGVDKREYWAEHPYYIDDEVVEPRVETWYEVELPSYFVVGGDGTNAEDWKLTFQHDPKLTPGMKVKIRIEIEQIDEG